MEKYTGLKVEGRKFGSRQAFAPGQTKVFSVDKNGLYVVRE